MKKRLYYESMDVVEKKQKGWVEVETDFVQVYSGLVNVQLTASAMQLLLFLVFRMDKRNKVTWDKLAKAEFGNQSDRMMTKMMRELVDMSVVVKVGRGSYLVNPRYVWKGTPGDRLKMIGLFVKYLDSEII